MTKSVWACAFGTKYNNNLILFIMWSEIYIIYNNNRENRDIDFRPQKKTNI